MRDGRGCDNNLSGARYTASRESAGRFPCQASGERYDENRLLKLQRRHIFDK
jgi:hypothetical protein